MSDGADQLQRILETIRDDDGDGFRGVLTSDFARDIADSDVRDLSSQLSSSLLNGYTMCHLGALKQDGDLVHLWQIGFSDGSDDALVRLVLDDEKVAGVLITPPFA